MKLKKNIRTNKAMTKLVLLVGVLAISALVSCEKFLDYKPDKKLVIPSSLQDCQAILDNYGQMNSAYPNYAEAVSDNIYLLDAGYNSQSVSNRDTYLWKADADPNFGDWQNTYQKVLYANQVLETLSHITPSTSQQNTWNELKGAALFFRAYALFYAAQIWAKPYNPATSSQDLGIPIKLTTDLNEKTDRGNVQQTYDRILQDMQEALDLLPLTTALQSRPSKVAVYATLARIYLAMSDYTNALKNADACLQRYNVLMDYNQLNASASIPFSQFNKEVIFSSKSAGGAQIVLLPSNARVVPELYATYEENDLRRTVFFVTNADLTHSFKGNYDGGNPANSFTGPATDEIYLIRAECYARAGKTTEALADLNTLLKTRWSNTVTYVDKTAPNAEDALKMVLLERRKELLYRFTRWSDLRRLNKDSRFAVTLSRTILGQTYTLPPNDLRYALLIPREVLNRGNLQQNLR